MNRIGQIIFPPAFATAIMAMLLGLVVLMGPSLAGTNPGGGSPKQPLLDCSKQGCPYTASCGDDGCPTTGCGGCTLSDLDPNTGLKNCNCTNP